MSIERCPVCNGSGRITEPAPAHSSSAFGATRTCHGCFGRGWIGLDEAIIRTDARSNMALEVIAKLEVIEKAYFDDWMFQVRYLINALKQEVVK